MNPVEIKYISENEFWIGENKVHILDNNLIHVVVIGDQNTELAKVSLETYKKVLTKTEGKVNHLIDLNRSGKNSPEARAIWQQISGFDKTNKVAVFGMHPVARVIASFVIGSYAKKNLRFFSTKEEAMAWLTK